MKNKLLLLLVLAVSGCATWIPAAVKQIEPGVYQLSTTGNSFASIEGMREKLDKKAESVCEGKGFEYREEAGVESHQQKDYSTGMTTYYKRMEMTVVCNP